MHTYRTVVYNGTVETLKIEEKQMQNNKLQNGVQFT